MEINERIKKSWIIEKILKNPEFSGRVKIKNVSVFIPPIKEKK